MGGEGLQRSLKENIGAEDALGVGLERMILDKHGRNMPESAVAGGKTRHGGAENQALGQIAIVHGIEQQARNVSGGLAVDLAGVNARLREQSRPAVGEEGGRKSAGEAAKSRAQGARSKTAVREVRRMRGGKGRNLKSRMQTCGLSFGRSPG